MKDLSYKPDIVKEQRKYLRWFDCYKDFQISFHTYSVDLFIELNGQINFKNFPGKLETGGRYCTRIVGNRSFLEGSISC